LKARKADAKFNPESAERYPCDTHPTVIRNGLKTKKAVSFRPTNAEESKNKYNQRNPRNHKEVYNFVTEEREIAKDETKNLMISDISLLSRFEIPSEPKIVLR
jgi:hypothetical protein